MNVQFIELRKKITLITQQSFPSKQLTEILNILKSIYPFLDQEKKKLFLRVKHKWDLIIKLKNHLKQPNMQLLMTKKLQEIFHKGYFAEQEKYNNFFRLCQETLSKLKEFRTENQEQEIIFAQKEKCLSKTKILFNPKFLCGSQFFIQGVKIFEHQMEHYLIKLNKSDLHEKNEEAKTESQSIKKDLALERLLCAGLNGSHTYISVGICKNNIIRGEIFSESEKQMIISKIDKISCRIYPQEKNKFRIRFIPVMSDCQKAQKSFINGLFVLLIEFNESKRKLYFIKQKQQKQKIQQGEIIKIQGQKLYKKMHKIEVRKKKFRIHDQCVEPDLGSILLEIKMKYRTRTNLSISINNIPILLFLLYQIIKKVNTQRVSSQVFQNLRKWNVLLINNHFNSKEQII